MGCIGTQLGLEILTNNFMIVKLTSCSVSGKIKNNYYLEPCCYVNCALNEFEGLSSGRLNRSC